MQIIRCIILLIAGLLTLWLFAGHGFRAETGYPGERVFLHTDKPYAVPGERVWFKAYIFSDEFVAGKTESTLLNVDLVNIENEIVFSGKYKINGNSADGCLDIPSDLVPGVYCLLYYTDYMKYRGEKTKSKILPVFDLYADYEKNTSEESPENRHMSHYPENEILIAGNHLDGKNNHGREFFRNSENILLVEITTDKDEYLPGEEVFIRLKTTGHDGKPQGADLSVAVVDEQQFDAGLPWQDNIADLSLTGHLRGQMTEHTKRSGNIPGPAMKNIMSLRGRVVYPVTGLPASYQLILLSTVSGKPALQSVFTDSDGYFYFELNEFAGEAMIRVQLFRETERAELLVLDKSSVIYSKTFRAAEIPAALQKYNIDATPSDPVQNILHEDGSEIIFSLQSKPEIRLFLNPADITCCNFNYDISDMVTSKVVNYINRYRIRELAGLLHEQADTVHISRNNILPPLYTTPDLSYNLDEYIAFENVGQLFNDLVMGVNVRGRGTEQYFVTSAGGSMFDGKPLIIINGVPATDAGVLLGMDPAIIRQIDILTSPQSLAKLPAVCKNGVIAVYLRYDDFRFPESGGMKTYRIQGLSRTCMPGRIADLDTGRYTRMPDLRPVLFWDPYVSTDVNGDATFSFRNSDDITNYRIIVQGLSHQGLPGYGSVLYRVKGK